MCLLGNKNAHSKLVNKNTIKYYLKIVDSQNGCEQHWCETRDCTGHV